MSDGPYEQYTLKDLLHQALLEERNARTHARYVNVDLMVGLMVSLPAHFIIVILADHVQILLPLPLQGALAFVRV